jgi:hypothetical protein
VSLPAFEFNQWEQQTKDARRSHHFHKTTSLFSIADFRQRIASKVSLHIRVHLSLKTHPATEKVRSLDAALAGIGRTLRASRYNRGKRF